MKDRKLWALLRFLIQDLALPVPEIRLALRLSEERSLTNLPIVLWQYGLVTIAQLDQIFDWLEHKQQGRS